MFFKVSKTYLVAGIGLGVGTLIGYLGCRLYDYLFNSVNDFSTLDEGEEDEYEYTDEDDVFDDFDEIGEYDDYEEDDNEYMSIDEYLENVEVSEDDDTDDEYED